jgi:hypothetical protein
MISRRTALCQQLYDLSELMDVLSMQISHMTADMTNPTHYVNVFGRHDEWKHKIDIKQRAYTRLLERFNNIKQQLQ